MYPRDKDILQRLLTLIDQDQYALALQIWSDHRHKVAQSCSHCSYKKLDINDDCCMCLEGKLRMMSLYHHSDHPNEDILINAARKLDAFRNNAG